MDGEYIITVVVGDWSVTLSKGDIADPSDDAIALDPLSASWSLTGAYPSQPQPTTCSFGLYVPDVTTGPKPVQGSRVEVTITTADHASADVEPVLDFVGLITDIDGAPFKDGIRFSIIAADYTSTLSEERIGYTDWPYEDRHTRLMRIIAESSLVIDSELAAEIDSFPSLAVEVGPRPANAATTRSVLDELAPMLHWMGTIPPWWKFGFDGGFGDPFWAPPGLVSWLMPIVGQSVDDAGVVTLPVTALPGGGPDITESLPYTLTMLAGDATLLRKNIEPADSRVCWIPAAAVDAKAVTWRQDKATNPNRIRATGSAFVFYGQTGANLLEGFADLIAAYGPNELSIDLTGATQDTTTVAEARARTTFSEVMLWARLGTHYDASPRWALDQISILAEAIESGDQWPRLFSPRTHSRRFDQAAGKLVLVTDIAERWNLHDRGDYFGRLAGASLDLSRGRITWTAQLAHRLPIGSGLEGYTIGDPTHSPITAVELAAGANPTYAQCGDLTPADLQLVEG